MFFPSLLDAGNLFFNHAWLEAFNVCQCKWAKTVFPHTNYCLNATIYIFIHFFFEICKH